MFVDNQKRQKFDAITAPHEAALISMGVIEKAERAARDEGPECPSIFIGTFDKYREIKFIKRETELEVKMFSRDMLTWTDLIHYQQAIGQKIGVLEAELIMGIDGVFEGRDDA
ncbi:hypothetical protein D3C73_1028550 [compost metagenome]